MKPRRPPLFQHIARAVLALTLCACVAGASAQLRLPSLNLPQRIGPLDTDGLRTPANRLLGSNELTDLRELRLGQVARLLRQHRDVLEADPRGEPVVRREILAWSPSPAGLAAAAAAGLSVISEQVLDGLDQTMVVLRVPDNADTATMLDKLRALDPAGAYDFNHVYTGSSASPMNSAPAAGQPDPATPKKGGSVAVGLIDSGVDSGHIVFRDASIRRWGCNERAHPSAHGTAVAALMVGQSSRFRGVAPSASLYAADIYCDSGTGGSADKIAGALAWLAREKVAVINMSLVGPPNQTLERAVGAMVQRGHLLVAAVGNDGPAAAPLYPASYPGVVGVSAVDKQGRTLPEAARGPQVMFAAPGNNMVSAAVGAPPYRQVRGTSFAAPIVAALLANTLARPDPANARTALAALAKQASKAGAATVSNETGYGVVGESFRVDPASFR
jgi:hypothetical protein